jgi:hypothetical protein
MTFVFFTFTISPRSTQICWSVFPVITVPPLTPTLERGHLQKTTTICARLLGLVHRILYHPNTLIGHPNIAQIVGG